MFQFYGQREQTIRENEFVFVTTFYCAVSYLFIGQFWTACGIALGYTSAFAVYRLGGFYERAVGEPAVSIAPSEHKEHARAA